MKVSEILATSTKAFPSIEIVPPLRGITNEELLESIAPFMEFKPKYINVTSHRDEYEFRQNEDGTFSRHLIRNRISETTVCAAIMSKYDVEVVPHLICGGNTKEEIESKLDNLAFMGISNIVALRGDSLTGEKRFTPTPGGYSYASELVEGIKCGYVGMNYVLASELPGQLFELKADFESGESRWTTGIVENVPLKRNHRTYLYGNFFVDDVDLDILIIPAYEDENGNPNDDEIVEI